MKPYIQYNDTLDPDANSYQGKLARKSKALIPEERQGHLNRMKKSFKSGYHEKELTVPLVKMPCPQSFINGPDTLDVGEAGVFHTRAVESFNSFDIQSVWRVSTPANMGYDQKIIDSIPPYTGKESTPKKYAKPSGERRWSKDGITPTKRWFIGGDDRKWSTDSGKKRWEGHQELAEDTGEEKGFCRAEYKFNHSGMVRIDSTPVLPGVSPLLKSSPKYVMVMGRASRYDYSDNFDDNSINSQKWNNPVTLCFNVAEQNQEMQFYYTGLTFTPYYHVAQEQCQIKNKCPSSWFLNSNHFQVDVDFSLSVTNEWFA